MTKLADKFLLALADQGYGFTFTGEDLRILGANHRGRHHVPLELLEEPLFEVLLIGAIVAFAVQDGRFSTVGVLDDEPRPGLN